ncbi:MAG TPA: glycosyltransferase, partial [Rhizobium sp.]
VGFFSGVALELTTIEAGPMRNSAAIGALGSLVGSVGLHGTIVKATSETVALLSATDCAAAYQADALGFDSYKTLKAFISRAEIDRFAGLLPTKVIIDPDPQQLRLSVLQALCTLASARAKRLRAEQDEEILMRLARRWRGDSTRSQTLLSIVISTYNRSAFVCENVRWVLSIIKKYGDKINLVVVDNASTDDSWSKLQNFSGNRQLRLIRNPANTGMLGNLHVCSTLKLARHVWVTGDDDYIVADALGAVLKILETEPALPLLMSNFAVYHRGRLMDDDEASRLIAEGAPLAPNPRPSGLYELRDVAAEHDNLFTAIYPIVFRSDVLAACFNYPFTGVPFGDLVESVPTTKLLLETYAYCPTYWLHAVGIVGNAHNSWTRHRPRWHGVLMPMVLELAREAGVNSAKLYQWAKMHNDLLQDALRIAKAENFMIHLDDPGDLKVGYRVFRKPIDVKRIDHPTTA